MNPRHALSPRFAFALLAALLFHVSGGALLTHMAVAHDDGPAQTTGDDSRPYDHARDCDLGHLLHGFAASLAPPATAPTFATGSAIVAPAPDRPAIFTAHLSRRSRAPPAGRA